MISGNASKGAIGGGHLEFLSRSNDDADRGAPAGKRQAESLPHQSTPEGAVGDTASVGD